MYKRPSPKYRITNTYIADPSRDLLLIRTRFESLDGGVYQLYLLANPSMAGGGASNNAWWDGTNSALMASGTRSLFGSPTTVVSALKVGSPNVFVGNDNGYAAMASDCNVELHKNTHECGINRTYLSSVERSERNVSIDNIGRIAEGLGVEAWTLLRDG